MVEQAGPDKRISAPHRSAPVRFAYRLAGLAFLIIGVIGLVLPLLPGTVFLILAAASFARSSPRLEEWLLNHPKLGPPVLKWRETGAIPRKAKIIACLSMAFSFGLVIVTAPPIGIVMAGLSLSAAALYVATRPD